MSLVIDKNIDRLKQGKYVELTDILVEVPRSEGILDQLGLFEEVFTSSKKIEIQRTSRANMLVKDKNWEDKAQTVVGKSEHGFIQLSIPNMALLDAIKPQDIDGVAKVSDIFEAAGLEEVASVRLDKLATINASFDDTEEAARMQLLKEGTVYAPNGTLATSYGPTINFYTEMGKTRSTYTIPLTANNDPRIAVSNMVKATKEALRSAPTRGNYKELVVLCGTDLFDAVVVNPFVTEVTKYFNQDLARLLTGVANQAQGYNSYFREVNVWGVRFIDAGTGGYENENGVFTPWIAADKGILVPTGVRGMFKTYYAPANRFRDVNKKARGRYYWEKINEDDDLIQMKVESNFMNGLLYPAAVADVAFT